MVDLIRIKTLCDAGVPLARIEELLNAQPEEFADAITKIDWVLQRKIRDLTEHRQRLAQLAGGERLFLPDEVVDIIDGLRAIGVSERTVRIERDAWILVVALSPELVTEWAKVKRAAMDDPEFRQIYLAGDEAFDRDPADPRLRPLARKMAAWAAKRDREHPAPVPAENAAPSAAVTLLSSHITAASPAWQKLEELSTEYHAPPGELPPS